MRSFAAAVLAVLLSVLAQFISAHPSTPESRAEPETVHVPIEELLKDSKVESSGTGGQTTDVVSVPGSPAKRSPIGNPCANQPCCTLQGHGESFTKEYRWRTINWTQHLGVTRRISEPICPPGSVTNSRTISYSYSINVQLGPDLKFGPAILDKFGIRVGFSYTWGTATTVGYTAACSDGDNFPCFAVFSPRIGKIYGVGWIETIGNDKKTVCEKTQESHMEISVPIVGSTDCSGDRNPCGPAGVYDHCFATGQQAKDLCPRSNLNLAKPPKRVCPAGITGESQ